MKFHVLFTSVFFVVTGILLIQLQSVEASEDVFAPPTVFSSPSRASGATANPAASAASPPAPAPTAAPAKNPNMPREVYLDSQQGSSEVETRRPSSHEDDDVDDQRYTHTHKKAKRGQDSDDSDSGSRHHSRESEDGDFVNVD